MRNLILDVDGVFTDGKFYYSQDGKIMKVFGDADSDSLSVLKSFLNIRMITGDKRGFNISKKRIGDDMGFNIDLVSTFQRVEWIEERFDLKETIYMGDGIFDFLVFKKIGYSIAPKNAFYNTKKYANFVTKSNGGEGAVAEASLHILKKFFNKDFDENLISELKSSGIWSKKM